MDMAAVWQQTVDKWNEVVAQVSDEQMSAPCATCPEWKVADLIEHTMHWQSQGAAALAGVDPSTEWADIQPAMSATLSDPSNLEGTVEAMGGMPKQQVAGFVIGDLLVHSWDLAQSIGADATLPAGAVRATYMGLQRAPEEMLRSETMFGPAVEVPADADPQTQLLGFVGRQP